MTRDDPYSDFRVVWAGGRQAREVAETLCDDQPVKSDSNMAASCVDARAHLLVLSNRTSFDLCSVAVPHGFDRSATRSIVAAVGGGPHSLLAATLADWLSRTLEVPAWAAYGYSDPSDLPQADKVLRRLSSRLPNLNVRTVEASTPDAMVRSLEKGTLLVIGAPGGSWFQRRFFGPGARIQAKAPGGTIVVNHNPARVYQVMQDPTAYGPNLRVADAIQLLAGGGIIVAEDGKLLGTVKAEALRDARQDLEIHHLMDEDVFLSIDDEIAGADDLIVASGVGLVPVVDDQARLVGCVTASDLSSRSLA